MVSRHRLYGPDLEPIEYWHIAPRDTAERARQDFLRGNISAGEFERRLELAWAKEEQDTTVIDRLPSDSPFEMPIGSGAQEESTMVIVKEIAGFVALWCAGVCLIVLAVIVGVAIVGGLLQVLSM